MEHVRPYATLRYEMRGAVATISLDRPECLNAYSMAMRDDLHTVLAAVDADPAVRVLVLRGRGPAFSTGGDLREFGSATSGASSCGCARSRWRRSTASRWAAAWRWRSSATSASRPPTPASRCPRR